MTRSALDPLVAGHQPNFFPWFGHFEKILKCEFFVYSDDVQYSKQSYTNRVEIPVSGSSTYLILPVRKGSEETIAVKQFFKEKATLKKLNKTLSINFGGLPFYTDLEPVMAEFERAYEEYETAADLNIYMNQFIAMSMGIRTPVKRGTELRLESFHRNKRLIERCRRLESRQYLCGQRTDGYQDESMLNEAGIQLRRIEYGIGKSLLGEDIKYSVLYGSAKIGFGRMQEVVNSYMEMREAS